MLTTLEPARTPPAQTSWSAGPLRTARLRTGLQRLVFGETYEDVEIELRAFAPRARVFAIAGAGATARALAAAGHRVTAVDISAAQIEYAQARALGGAARRGAVEQLLAWGRSLARVGGWSAKRIETFLALEDCQKQLACWDRWFDTPAWRMGFETLLGPRLLSLWYRNPFVHALPPNFGNVLRERLRRGWAAHANRDNPYAALLLLGKSPAVSAPAQHPIRFVCADAAEFLESAAPSSFDAFALSNIGDGAPMEYTRRLRAAIARAAAPGAVVVSRSFAEPGEGIKTNQALLDRSFLWGMVSVTKAAEGIQGSCAGNAGDGSCCTS
jgi:hypothetical protein